MVNLKIDQLKIPSFRDRKKKEWIKPNRAQETFQTPSIIPMYVQWEKRERYTENIWRNNGPKLPKFDITLWIYTFKKVNKFQEGCVDSVWITKNCGKFLMGLSDHLTCLLRNLYACQEATVRSGHWTMDWFQIRKGVHQGCILSPCLFNLYAEYIMWSARLDEA